MHDRKELFFNLDFYTSVTWWSFYSMAPGWKCEVSLWLFAAGSKVSAATALWNKGGEDFNVALLTSALAPLPASSCRFFQLGPAIFRLFLAQRSSCMRCDSVLLASGYIVWVHQSWLFHKNTTGNWYVCRWEHHVFLSEMREGEEHRMETVCFPNYVFCVCFAYIFIFIAYIVLWYM